MSLENKEQDSKKNMKIGSRLKCTNVTNIPYPTK